MFGDVVGASERAEPLGDATCVKGLAEPPDPRRPGQEVVVDDEDMRLGDAGELVHDLVKITLGVRTVMGAEGPAGSFASVRRLQARAALVMDVGVAVPVLGRDRTVGHQPLRVLDGGLGFPRAPHSRQTRRLGRGHPRSDPAHGDHAVGPDDVVDRGVDEVGRYGLGVDASHDDLRAGGHALDVASELLEHLDVVDVSGEPDDVVLLARHEPAQRAALEDEVYEVYVVAEISEVSCDDLQLEGLGDHEPLNVDGARVGLWPRQQDVHATTPRTSPTERASVCAVITVPSGGRWTQGNY